MTPTAGCVVAADGFESQVADGRDRHILKAGDITTCYQYRTTNPGDRAGLPVSS